MPVCMDEVARYGGGNAWERAFRGPLLTDKRLRRYELLGFYTPEARVARSEVRQAKAKQRQQRHGNFVETGGRLIFRP